MVKVSVEVRSGAAHFEVGVQAESIQRAMCFVKERYPMGEGRVSFPIEPAALRRAGAVVLAKQTGRRCCVVLLTRFLCCARRAWGVRV